MVKNNKDEDKRLKNEFMKLVGYNGLNEGRNGTWIRMFYDNSLLLAAETMKHDQVCFLCVPPPCIDTYARLKNGWLVIEWKQHSKAFGYWEPTRIIQTNVTEIKGHRKSKWQEASN